MAFSQLFAKEGLLGVDIGSSNIKILCAEPSKHGPSVVHAAICPTPPESVKEGVVINVADVASAIQFAVRSSGIKMNSAISAVAGPGVMVRNIQVPKMSEQNLRKSIAFEAGKYISSSVEDSVLEFEIIGDTADGAQMNVVLVAAPRAMIDSRVDVLEAAGLDPVAVDVEAFASMRALIDNGSDASLSDRTVALLDVGATHTEINLVSKGSLSLSRTIPIAGMSLTHALKNALSCDDNEAEQAKYSIDLSELASLPPGSTADPGLKAVQSLVDELLREIRRSINYHQSQLPEGSTDTSVDCLVLNGGASRLKGLEEYAKSRLNIETKVGKSLLNEVMSDSTLSSNGLVAEDIPLFVVSLGLAVKDFAVPVRQAGAA